MPRKIKKAQSLDVDIERATKNKKSSIARCGHRACHEKQKKLNRW